MDDWEIVREAWESDSEECQSCPYYGYDYATDTGADAWCDLGVMSGHDPQWCAAYDRIKGESEDE